MQDFCKNKTDEELVKLSLQKQDYFLCLMEKYEGRLISYVMRISSFNREDAEDVLQEVFVKAYFNLNNFDTKLKFSSWIYRITHNQTISQFRKNKVRPLFYFEENDLILLIDKFNLSKEVDDGFLKEKVLEVLQKMDKKYSEVLVLKFLEDKDYKEISDILKKPTGTVGTLINRAKTKFKNEFLKYEGKSQ
ncbi:MAG: RNA polymerase sigma factor [Candidatus Magasanikbacteria bacterium]|nr:RNA polymerase sigma factor [Candidatus Magasanikbacteria bacterium]